MMRYGVGIGTWLCNLYEFLAIPIKLSCLIHIGAYLLQQIHMTRRHENIHN